MLKVVFGELDNSNILNLEKNSDFGIYITREKVPNLKLVEQPRRCTACNAFVSCDWFLPAVCTEQSGSLIINFKFKNSAVQACVYTDLALTIL